MAVSFRDVVAGVEWLAAGQRPADGAGKGGKSRLLVQARSAQLNPGEAEGLIAEASPVGKERRRWILQVFPGVGGVVLRMEGATAPAQADKTQAAASGIELAAAKKKGAPEPVGDLLEDWTLAPTHLRLTEVTLLDQTDIRNELVFEREWLLMINEAPLALNGNVFSFENAVTGHGLALVKLAPLPHARPVKTAADLHVQAAKKAFRIPADPYPVAVVAYAGGRPGRTAALQALQRRLRPYQPGRDGMFLSNTWGDRSRDARIRADFILAEIEAGSRLGVDVVQIDDGWQKGKTANSARGKGVWNGYWAADPEFWRPDPERFPQGLEPIVAAARARGMKFGLWFGPDSSNDAANWRRDADCLLDFHRRLGIDYFKIDSLKSENPAAEANQRRFFARLLAESGERIVVDLDVTAEIRPGYFGAPTVGPIFVENRYTDFHRYWPHQTLRNLWKLSQYVDPMRLRMEFLNHARKTENYPDDPLAPAKWRADTLFATTMMANPLGWFETSNLSVEYLAAVAPLVATWKRERAAMHGGRLFPIGDAPDGIAWTGFYSAGERSGQGYVLVFRELNASPKAIFRLPGSGASTTSSPVEARATVLGGRGEAVYRAGVLEVNIPEPLDFLWVKLEPR